MEPQKGLHGGFDTLTHARVRAGQGDRSGARRILRNILRQDPWNREARDLFEQLAGRDRGGREPELERAPDLPVAATAEQLRDEFRRVLQPGDDRRIRRLNAWLGRISERQGGEDAG